MWRIVQRLLIPQAMLFAIGFVATVVVSVLIFVSTGLVRGWIWNLHEIDPARLLPFLHLAILAGVGAALFITLLFGLAAARFLKTRRIPWYRWDTITDEEWKSLK